MDNGDVGFTGGIWSRDIYNDVSISLSYSEHLGIYNFQLRNHKYEIQKPFGDKPSFAEFKETVLEEFHIKELYQPNLNRK